MPATQLTGVTSAAALRRLLDLACSDTGIRHRTGKIARFVARTGNAGPGCPT